MIKSFCLFFTLILSKGLYAQQTEPIATFVPAGFKILNVFSGDINGDGRTDKLLLLEVNNSLKPDTLTKLFPDTFNYQTRPVILLTAQPGGKLKQIARSDNVILDYGCCAGTGDTGPDGSAFQNITCSKGSFTIEYFYHGGSEHSLVDYTFRYSARLKDWVLEKIVTDTVSDEGSDTGGYNNENRSIQTAKNFGLILFSNFKTPYGN